MLHILYRNVRYNKSLPRAIILPIIYERKYEPDFIVPDAVQVHIKLPRSWKPQAGQWLNICIPGLSSTSLIQSHPFYLSEYRKDKDDDYAIFIVERRHGFTRNLFLHISNNLNHRSDLRAIIEGPFGNQLSLHLYGDILLIATGIGISAQLLYISQLLDKALKHTIKARRIVLFWEVESECKLITR